MPSVIDRINADHIANQAAHLAGEKLAGLMKRYADARHALDLATNPDPHYASVATRFAVDDRLAEVRRNIERHGEAYSLELFETIVEDAEEMAARKKRD